MSTLPIDVQVNVAQTVEISRGAQAQSDAPGVLQASLARTGIKEADHDRNRVLETPEDASTNATSEEGTGRGRAFLRQRGERRKEETEERAPREPGKGDRLDLKV